jgi:hypothetical protein
VSKRPAGRLPRGVIAGLCLFLSVMALPVGASSQTASGALGDEKLNARVKLTLGNTTAKVVAEELTKQTGLTIEAGAHLADRGLFVNLNGVPARAVLDSLGEMYGWTWYKTSDAHYLLTTHTVRTPLTVLDVARSVSAALPRDLRDFICGGPPLPGGATSLQERMNLPVPEMSQRYRVIDLKLGEVSSAEPGVLYESLKLKLWTGEKLPFTGLTPEERRGVLLIMVLRALQAGLPLLRGELASYQANPLGAELRVNPRGDWMSIRGQGDGISTAVRRPQAR